jgi:hypothetical protein
MGIQAIGQIPHINNAGMGNELLTSCGRTAQRWLRQIANRLDRVRITHGDWTRCLNHHFGGSNTAVFLDPPYQNYEHFYGAGASVADALESWVRDHADLRIALCGHRDDYNLPGWKTVDWSRTSFTYSGSKTIDKECVWYSPACLDPPHQLDMFTEQPSAKQESWLEMWSRPYSGPHNTKAA